MRTKLSPDFEPELFMNADEFRKQTEDGTYWGVPVDYFDIRSNTVVLKKEIASKLEWIVYETNGDSSNLGTPTQEIKVDGTEYDINPGFVGCGVRTQYVEALQ